MREFDLHIFNRHLACGPPSHLHARPCNRRSRPAPELPFPGLHWHSRYHTEVNSYTSISLGGLSKEKTVSHLQIPGRCPECGRYSVSTCGRRAGRQPGTGLQAYLGGRHVLKGHMAVGQLTGCDSHTVDVRLGIITLKILSREKKSHTSPHFNLGHCS